MSDVGIPAGVVNIVYGFGAEAGQPLYVFGQIFSSKGAKSNVSASAILESAWYHLPAAPRPAR